VGLRLLPPRSSHGIYGHGIFKAVQDRLQLFSFAYRKTEKIRDSFYHVKEFTYETATTPIFKRYLYDPMVRGLFKLAQYVKGFQMGSIHWYLAYIFVTILILVVIFGRP
jgi:hydrogenase-4 component B